MTRPSDRHRWIAAEPALDGLRGLAVAGVLAFHAGFAWAVGGFLGVSTFFTLSGFLITTLLIREREATGTVRLPAFWGRRFRRLMPAALLALGLIVAYGAFAATPEQVRTLRGDVLSALGYFANWRFLASGQSYAHLFANPSPVEHFWSLAIEEQFYVAFPLLTFGALLVGRGSRRVLGWVFAALAIGSVALTATMYHPGGDTARVYYGTDARAVELLAGALLAVVMARRMIVRRLVPRVLVVAIGTAGLAFTVAVWVTTSQTEHWLYQGGLGLYALGSAAIIAAAVQPGLVRVLLSPAPLRWLGRVSYGVYLYHWPVYLWLSSARTGLRPWPLFGLRVSVTLAVATASYYLVEQPIRSGRRFTTWRPLIVAPATALTVVVALVIVTANPPKPAISFTAPPPPRLPKQNMAALRAVPAPWPSPSPPGVPPARLPPPSLAPGEAPRVLIVGDSSAFQLGVGVANWGRLTGHLQVWDAGKFGCGLIPGGEARFLDTIHHLDGCNDWHGYWADDVTRVRPHLVLAMTGIWDTADRQLPGDRKWRAPGDKVYDAFVKARILGAIDFLSAQGATVVWLTSPYIKTGVTEGKPGPWPESSHKRMDRLNALVRQAVAERTDSARILDLERYMRRRPQGELDWAERPDGVHFTDVAAYNITDLWLGRAVEAIPTRS